MKVTKSDIITGTTELIERILLIIIFFYSLKISWWLPILVVPIFHQTIGFVFCKKRIFSPIIKLAADLFSFIIYIGYIAIVTYLFGKNIGTWHGWVLGLIVGLFIGQILGLLFPMRWHYEHIEGNL